MTGGNDVLKDLVFVALEAVSEREFFFNQHNGMEEICFLFSIII